MKNSHLAGILVDTLVSEGVLASSKTEDAIEKIQLKLNSLLRESDVTYSFQYIQNEKSEISDGKTSISQFRFSNKKMSDVSGVIYRKSMAIQSFLISNDGKFTFSRIGQASDIEVMSGTIDFEDGEMALMWNTAPGTNHVVMNYEYAVSNE